MKVETTLRVEICRLANLWESTIINLGCLMVHFSKCYGALVMGLYDQRVPLYYDRMIDNWIALLSKFRLTHEDWKTPLGGDSIEVMSAITAKFIHVTSINKREMKCTMCRSHRLITEFEILEDRWSLMCRRCAMKCQEVRTLDPLDPMSSDLTKITLFELLNQMMNTSIDVACQLDE
jgi:hypothetical protein